MRARAGGANTAPYFLAAHFAKRNMKFGGGGKKLESESEGGRKFLPPTPPPASLREALRAGLPFCPPERKTFSKFSVRIFAKKSSDFVQHSEPSWNFYIPAAVCLVSRQGAMSDLSHRTIGIMWQILVPAASLYIACFYPTLYG